MDLTDEQREEIEGKLNVARQQEERLRAQLNAVSGYLQALTEMLADEEELTEKAKEDAG